MDGLSGRHGSSMDVFLQKYKLSGSLGSGSYGEVKMAQHNLTGHRVAIKIFRKKIEKAKEEEQGAYFEHINSIENDEVRREIKIMRLLMHPHIVRLYEAIETPLDIFIVMEYANSGDLFDYLVQRGRLPEDEARKIFQQIISGVEHCHRNMIVHRDLKPENLLLDSHHNIKIADFGLSNIMRDGHFLKEPCGSPNYAAPEVVSDRLYAGPEVDVWSCGCILYALLCATLPFDDEMPNLRKKIQVGRYNLPSCLSSGSRDIIARMLVVDPMKRITIPEIRRHPWFLAHFPRYLAVRPPNAMQQARKIDEEILQEVVALGFDRNQLIQSLCNRVENQGTVAYYILFDNRFRVPGGYLAVEFQESMEHESMHPNDVFSPAICYHGSVDYQNIDLLQQFPVQRKWALGLQSRAHPCDIMTEVLNALHHLNVCWKKIGDYNMKCRWLSSFSAQPEGVVNVHIGNCCGDESIIVKDDGVLRSPSVVKFELQLYRTLEGKYLLDLQIVQGPSMLFLDLCAAFLAQLRVL